MEFFACAQQLPHCESHTAPPHALLQFLCIPSTPELVALLSTVQGHVGVQVDVRLGIMDQRVAHQSHSMCVCHAGSMILPPSKASDGLGSCGLPLSPPSGGRIAELMQNPDQTLTLVHAVVRTHLPTMEPITRGSCHFPGHSNTTATATASSRIKFTASTHQLLSQ